MADVPKSVLITGGAGYIGSHTAKALARAGFNPVTYDSLIRGHRWAVRWGPFVHGDIGDRPRLLEVFQQYNIDAVLHFAAFAYVGESVSQPEIYFENNVSKTLSLLETARLARIKHFVFSSSCATYGMPDAIPITEDTPQRPVNPYGETKLIVERALHWYGLAHGMSHVSLRYFNAAGADPDQEIGEDHLPETHLIPLVIDAALGNRVVEIFGTDYPTRDGTCVRDYVHVVDLADAHVRSLNYLLAGGPSVSLNLGTGTGHTIHEIIRMVERISGRPVPYRAARRRPGDPAALIADAGRAESVLYWKPVHSGLEDIVRTAWSWHSARSDSSRG